MNRKSSERYTSEEYSDNNPTWHTEDSEWKSNQIMKIITKNNLLPKSICEIGCGAGEILNQLFKKMPDNVKFIGYEISTFAYQLCIPKKTNRLDFKLYNLFDDNTTDYDVVMAIDVFEHVEDYFDFLRRLNKKGTYKIFHIPLEMVALYMFRKTSIMNCRAQYGHIHYFSKDTVLAILQETGYEVIDFFYTPVHVVTPTISFKQSLLSMFRKVCFRFNKDLTVRLLGGYSLLVLTK